MSDPLSAQCPACLAPPGEACYATSSDEPRARPHRLRGLATARHLVLCNNCQGIGWRPEGLETKEVAP
uniref:zinc finger domain-containing protein n=1 Tax=Nonomuraea sp. CA-251285 TaxID=3240002 RepID=UPI003F49A7AC